MRTQAALAVVVGLVTAVALATWAAPAAPVPGRPDALKLILIASGVALAVGAVGTLLMHLLQHRSVNVLLSIVALTSVVAVAAGSWSAARLMFLTPSDLLTLAVVMLAAAGIGVGVAFELGVRLTRASHALADTTRSIGSPTVGSVERPAIREFAELSDRLEEAGARLEEARIREQAMDASRRELVSWVSHDLRTPLAGILAVTEALEDGVVTDPATVQRYLRGLAGDARRLAALVDDLFELSRISSGALRLHREPALLEDLVSDALAAEMPVATAKGVTLDGRMRQPVAPLSLAASEFGRVLRNLLQNAVRATPPGGSVLVEGGADDTGAWVAVQDACGGIAEDDLPRIFDRGFRGSAARTPTSEGRSGLGLAIARGFVEAHGGDISVTNSPPGCRFLVRLPLVPDGRPDGQPDGLAGSP